MATLFQPNQEVKCKGTMQIRKLLNIRSRSDYLIFRSVIALELSLDELVIDSGPGYVISVRGANGFSVLPEEYFSGSENVNEFLEGIDNQIRLLEIPSDLSCAYLKGHLLGRAQKWYQIFGFASVQNTATDFAQLKMAWSKTFPAIRNKKDLEINNKNS
ncbi:UNVERIFIED_CONTAM: hypothetical protein NCL1_41904 [Trichonephila clavipes]